MYKAIKNTVTLNRPKNGKQIKIEPITEWSVRKMPENLIIAHIPDWYADSKQVASGIAQILNKNRTIKFNINF